MSGVLGIFMESCQKWVSETGFLPFSAFTGFIHCRPLAEALPVMRCLYLAPKIVFLTAPVRDSNLFLSSWSSTRFLDAATTLR